MNNNLPTFSNSSTQQTLTQNQQLLKQADKIYKEFNVDKQLWQTRKIIEGGNPGNHSDFIEICISCDNRDQIIRTNDMRELKKGILLEISKILSKNESIDSILVDPHKYAGSRVSSSKLGVYIMPALPKSLQPKRKTVGIS